MTQYGRLIQLSTVQEDGVLDIQICWCWVSNFEDFFAKSEFESSFLVKLTTKVYPKLLSVDEWISEGGVQPDSCTRASIRA
jgi:hypothetical protein